MDISVSEAKGVLTDLVRRAESGEEVLLTRHGEVVVRLVPVKRKLAPAEFDILLDNLQAIAARIPMPQTDAAHSQDFLYDEDGLPG
ncbi:MAG: type II toxin-antitoxin system Phd/YefM family antitoxin [Gemmobacter sp.]